MNFAPALDYQFCLALPAAITQPGIRLFNEPCIFVIHCVCQWAATRKGCWHCKHTAQIDADGSKEVSLQGWDQKWFPGCENISDKLRQKK